MVVVNGPEHLACCLLSLVAFHSGDRTPKQKVKLKVTEENLLELMLKYNGGKPRCEVQYITVPFVCMVF